MGKLVIAGGSLRKTESMLQLGQAIHLSIEKRENSWTEERNQYTIPLREAVMEAIDELKLDRSMFKPVYLLVSQNWNDALDWANSVLEEKKEESK